MRTVKWLLVIIGSAFLLAGAIVVWNVATYAQFAGFEEQVNLSFWFNSWTAIGCWAIGAALLITGILIHVYKKQRLNMILMLKREGIKCEGVIESIAERRWFMRNGRPWQQLLVSVKLNGNTYRFFSEYLSEEVRLYKRQGDKVRVYIHPDNPMLYWVDTSFLPEKQKSPLG